jgi:predicted DNA binding CopG/RHH family protein
MKYYQLDKDEENILNSFDKGEFVSVAKKAVVKGYVSSAKTTLNRERHINIRLSERDLQKLKLKAAEKGIPYQTLVSSVLHQYGAQ